VVYLSLTSFRKYLKRKGKKDSVIERNINTVESFYSFISSKMETQTSNEDIHRYVKIIENEGKSAKGFLYVMMNYFQYRNDRELYLYTAKLREERTSKTRRKFQIKDFLGISKEAIEKLRSIGIKDVDQMLEQGRTREQRNQLALIIKVPEDVILELVNLSDLTRMGYVKRKLSRLYYEAGIRSPSQVSKYEPNELYEHFKAYVEETGWEGMIPNRKDLEHNIKNARKLPVKVEY